MEIKILSPEVVEFKEKDVQMAFEKDLSMLEDGLQLVASEFIMPTGRIDTLAFDTNSGRPVFIEFKRSGEFGKDALIQLMDYLSWFARDENRRAVLEKVIRQHRPDIEIEEFDPSIRLICVVTDIEERVRNAIYAIANHVKVYSYMVAKDTANNIVLVPKLEVDNGEVESAVRPATSESELLRTNPHLEQVYLSLKELLEAEGSFSYATGQRSLRFKKERVFALIRFRKKYLQLELRVGIGALKDSDFKYWRKGNSPWGYTSIFPGKAIPEKIKTWIDQARVNSSQSAELETENDETPA